MGLLWKNKKNSVTELTQCPISIIGTFMRKHEQHHPNSCDRGCATLMEVTTLAWWHTAWRFAVGDSMLSDAVWGNGGWVCGVGDLEVDGFNCVCSRIKMFGFWFTWGFYLSFLRMSETKFGLWFWRLIVLSLSGQISLKCFPKAL